MLNLLKKQLSRLPLTPAGFDEAGISSMYKDASSGLQYVYLQQRWQDIIVHNSMVSIALKDDKIAYASGGFVDSMAQKAGAPLPAVTPAAAVQKAAMHLGLPAPVALVVTDDQLTSNHIVRLSPGGIAKRNISCELVWASLEEGRTVRLAWNVNIDVLGSPDWWNVRVDAQTGAILAKDNWTQYESNHAEQALASPLWLPGSPKTVAIPWQRLATPPPSVTTSSYRVYPFPAESPNYSALAIETDPWLKAGSGNNATTNGWHYDGNTSYTTTRGNNVYAYEDSSNLNVPGQPSTSTTGFPALTFQFTPDFTQTPYQQQNLNLARTNLFYWSNIIHDVTYQYGFNEAAGNFQANNIGRGGQGNDYVLAEAIDGAGINNANFNTPVDGISGRMQMFIWSTPTGPKMTVLSPAAIAGDYMGTEGSYSAQNLLIRKGPVTGTVAYVNDNAGGTAHLGCAAPANAGFLSGKIALIDRGTCNFTVKIKNAQNAGAIAAIVVNNVPGAGPAAMGGTDATIVIPSISISYEDGNTLKAQLSSNPTVTLTTGTFLDGDLDNGVIVHEFGHGVSNRLTGGPANSSCLYNAEQGGEGWSDYLALMTTTNWSAMGLNSGTLRRAIGTYVNSQTSSGSGIRRYPYTTDMTINPLTYASLTTTTSGTEAHNMGEVWCSALWDMTWNIIQQEGTINNDIYNAPGSGGNTISLRLVIQGMKLQPCNPGYLDARNAILAADSILYNGVHTCSIWNAFARRGMGLSAKQGSVWSAADGTPAYDVPGGVILTRTSTPVLVYPGNQITYTVTAACRCSPVSGFTVRDTIPANFTYVGSTGGTVSGNIVSFPVTLSTPLQKQNLSVTLSPVTGACNVDSSIHDDRDTYTTGGLTSTILSGSYPWSVATDFSTNGTHSWSTPDPSAANDVVLTSAPFTVGNLSILSFQQYRYLDNEYDAARVELSTNGTTWVDAGPYFVQNGYNTTIDASTPPWAGLRAFSGNTVGFEQSILDLSSFTGQTLRIRFHVITDAGNNPGRFDGVRLDEILQLNGCGGLIKAGLYNASDVLVASGVKPVFVSASAPLPLTLTRFTAAPVGNQVQLRWNTETELNTASFDVEHSTNGRDWNRIITVAAAGSGNHAYEGYHASPAMGLNHYRLKMIDQDGRTMYSAIRTVIFSTYQAPEFTMVPNPAAEATVLYFGKALASPEISVYNALGQLVSSQKVSGSVNQHMLSLQSLSSGTYLVVVRAEGKELKQKLLVQ